MPTAQEIRSSLRGAFRLFLFDPQGVASFNVSIEGFWHSFFAAVLIAPAYFAVVIIERDLANGLIDASLVNGPVSVPSLRETLVAEAFAYPAYVVAFPIAMVGLARLLKLTGRYVPYVIAYNWSSVVVISLRLLPLVLYSSGLLGAEAAATPIFASFLAVLIYRWYLARVVLGVGGPTAFALVLIDLMLMLLIESVTEFALN
jgi:hypothetical protein